MIEARRILKHLLVNNGESERGKKATNVSVPVHRENRLGGKESMGLVNTQDLVKDLDARRDNKKKKNAGAGKQKNPRSPHWE